MSKSRIGVELFITVNTVEWHLRGAYEKPGVRSKTGILSNLFSELAPPDLFEPDPAESEPLLIAKRR